MPRQQQERDQQQLEQQADEGEHDLTSPFMPANSMSDEDWEEWDGTSPFWIHCAAGSFAGVVEHTVVYPLDTVRTHIQVCASCVHRNSLHSFAGAGTSNAAATTTRSLNASGQHAASSLRGRVRMLSLKAPQQMGSLPTGFWQTMRFLINEPVGIGVAPVSTVSTRTTASAAVLPSAPSHAALWTEISGMTRLWRGVQAILIGCIPAHALYFSSYEIVKTACTTTTTTAEGSTTTDITWWGSSLAGAAAVMGHDVIMTPLDTIKQRMQLGHYTSARTALSEIVRREGFAALYRSFPITLLTNLPYGMVMVTTHESCKRTLPLLLDPHHQRRQPSWQTVLLASSLAGFTASALTTPLDRIKTALQTQALAPACLVNPTEPCKRSVVSGAAAASLLAHDNWHQAAQHIWRTEGWRRFCRGFWPRVLSHTPAVAISWTTYETTKQALLQHYHH